MNVRLLVIVLIALVPVSTGCRFKIHETSNRWSDRAWLDGATREKEQRFEVTSKIDALRFDLDARASLGYAQWTVTDPEGEIAANAMMRDGGSLEIGMPLTPQVGVWTVKTELVGYEGDYSARLSATGGSKLDFVVLPSPEE